MGGKGEIARRVLLRVCAYGGATKIVLLNCPANEAVAASKAPAAAGAAAALGDLA